MGGAMAAPSSKVPQRIITIGAPVTETVAALGGLSKIIATDTTSTYPEAVQKLPKVGYMRRLSTEGLLGLTPDLIIAPADAGPAQVFDDLKRLNIPVLRLNTMATLEQGRTAIATIGDTLGYPEKAQNLITKLQTAAKPITTDAITEQKPSALFLLSFPPNPMMAAGANTPVDQLITAAGGRNVFAGHESYKSIAADVLAQLNPDVVITSTTALNKMGGLAAMQKDPVMGMMPAVQKGHVVTLEGAVLLGIGPRTPDAISTLRHYLHMLP
jgi:iron complex transport system substrate-binding protein